MARVPEPENIATATAAVTGTGKPKPETLPETAWDWITFLKAKLEATPVTEQIHETTLTLARALFQIILTGSFEGKEIFGEKGPLTASLPDAKFLRKVKLSFGITGKKTATQEQKQIYYESFGSIVKRGFRLDQLLPDSYLESEEKLSALEVFAERKGANDWIYSSDPCWKLASEYKKGELGLGDPGQRHAFLLLYVFWIIANYQCRIYIWEDLLGLKEALGDLKQFVERCR